MARRRRTHKPTWDLGLSPEQLREIIAVLVLVLSGLFLLSLVGIGGRVGELTATLFTYLWGSVGYVIPVGLFVVGVALLFPERFPLRRATALGLVLLVVVVPTLASLVVPSGGGLLGDSVANLSRAAIDGVGSYILFIGLLVVSLLMVTSRSLAEFIGLLRRTAEADETDDTAAEPRVSVFTTVKGRMGAGARALPDKVSVATAPMLVRRDPNWDFPGVELLSTSQTKAQAGNISKNVELIQKSLKDFHIDVSMGDVHIGPTVTQYTLKPADGVKLNQITARQQDLALSLAAHPIRIEAPIPGKAAVGIELPNKVAATVTLREMLESEDFSKSKSRLALALGRDVAGLPISVDLEKMPHMLIAGATGAGKSIAINSIILTLLYRNSPADLRLVLVDPKRVEFTHFNGIPHLLTPVVTEPEKTVNVLRWAVAEMERRYRMFAEIGSRDIQSYNEKKKDEALPFIVVVIDELADLMAQSAKEVEGAIVRLAQMARATGIHLIVATQRPSVDVITGLIKANIATRIAFAVASQIDSRTIIDQSGAEKLLGRGDMLYLGADFANKPKRIQGVYVTEKDIDNVTNFLKSQGAADYNDEIPNFGARAAVGAGGDGGSDDDLYNEAKQTVIQAGKASASLLQRRLRVGYARAARLLDILESQGVIGPADGARPRDVLADVSELSGDNHGFDDSRSDGYDRR